MVTNAEMQPVLSSAQTAYIMLVKREYGIQSNVMEGLALQVLGISRNLALTVTGPDFKAFEELFKMTRELVEASHPHSQAAVDWAMEVLKREALPPDTTVY